MSRTVTFPIRVRTTSRTVIDGKCTNGNCSNTTANVSTRNLANATAANSIIYGENIRGWKTRIRKGHSASTNLTFRGRDVQEFKPWHFSVLPRCKTGIVLSSCSKLDGTRTGITVIGEISNVSYPSSDPDNLDTEPANILALQRLYANIGKHHKQVEGGVIAGEIAKTLRMIRHPAKNLWGQVQAVAKTVKKRIYRLKPRDRKEFLTDTYLEATFGWLPLMSDVKSGAEALAELALRERGNTIWVSGDSRSFSGMPKDLGRDLEEIVDLPLYGGATLLSGSSQISVNRATSESSFTRVKYYGKMRIEPFERLYMKSELLGFNPQSWLPTAWELMPYSFLVDYFTNIGEVINAWSTNTSDLLWVTKTIARSYVRTGLVRMDPTFKFTQQYNAGCAGWTLIKEQVGVLKLARRTISRDADALTQVRVPSFTFKVPGIGSMKWLNIAALGVCKSKVQLFK